MEFSFRAATTADIPALMDLIAASVRHLQLEYSEAEREAAIRTVFTVDSTLVADGTYLIATAANGQLAGCGGWSRRKTLYGGDHQMETLRPETLEPSRDAARIRAIFVHPDFVRMGLGGTILELSEAAAAKEGFKRFEMGSTLAGLALYCREGYRELERILVPVGPDLFIEVVRMAKEATIPSP